MKREELKHGMKVWAICGYGVPVQYAVTQIYSSSPMVELFNGLKNGKRFRRESFDKIYPNLQALLIHLTESAIYYKDGRSRFTEFYESSSQSKEISE